LTLRHPDRVLQSESLCVLGVKRERHGQRQ
jgi:hypothetical protein